MFSHALHELTEREAEDLAAKLPLVPLTEKEEKDWAHDWASRNARMIGIRFAIGEQSKLGRDYRADRRRHQESVRFQTRLKETECRFDSNRGKYLAQLPVKK